VKFGIANESNCIDITGSNGEYHPFLADLRSFSLRCIHKDSFQGNSSSTSKENSIKIKRVPILAVLYLSEVQTMTEEPSALERYEFQRTLEALRGKHGTATELISLYIPPTKQVPDVTTYLRNEFSQSSNIKSKSTRKNVTAAIESILSRLRGFRTPPPKGLVFFVGHVSKGANQTEMVQFMIEPLFPITTFLYRCSSQFHLEPLEMMLMDKDAYALLVIDRSEASIGVLRGQVLEVLKNVPSRVPSKHGRGGQSARRFERLIEIAAHEFYKKVGDLMTDIFLNEPDIKGILIGGPGATKDFFLGQGYLHHELKKKVIDTFDTGYTNPYGLSELMGRAEKTLSNLDIMHEKKLLQRFYNEIRKDDGGLSAYGESQVLDALRKGAVDMLLVSETLRKINVKGKCTNCDYSVQKTLTDEVANLGDCPKCNIGVVEVTESTDIILEMAREAKESNSSIELISGDSSEGEIFRKAFGGLAGILRYRLT